MRWCGPTVGAQSALELDITGHVYGEVRRITSEEIDGTCHLSGLPTEVPWFTVGVGFPSPELSWETRRCTRPLWRQQPAQPDMGRVVCVMGVHPMNDQKNPAVAAAAWNRLCSSIWRFAHDDPFVGYSVISAGPWEPEGGACELHHVFVGAWPPGCPLIIQVTQQFNGFSQHAVWPSFHASDKPERYHFILSPKNTAGRLQPSLCWKKNVGKRLWAWHFHFIDID